MTNRSDRDVLWDHFVNTAPADAKNDLTPHVQAAPEGRVYPVQSASDDPATNSQTIKDLGQWLGANMVGIAALDETLQPVSTPEAGGESIALPLGIVCVVFSDYDPEQSKGMGGQQAAQVGAVILHHLRAYILELGFRASFSDLDSATVAEAAALGHRNQNGQLVTRSKSPHSVASYVLCTDLPLAPDGRLNAS
ncbi:MAG: hypothetical protein CMJ45_01545 [Planctomyces sp.]|nr:hypothetical protein [Planctomyces sp.]